MGSLSIWHWLIVLAVVVVLFGGGGKLSGIMGDFGKGLKSFKKNMNEEPDASMEASAARPAGSISSGTVSPATSQAAAPAANPVRDTVHNA